jgi:hypothetical protein
LLKRTAWQLLRKLCSSWVPRRSEAHLIAIDAFARFRLAAMEDEWPKPMALAMRIKLCASHLLTLD